MYRAGPRDALPISSAEIYVTANAQFDEVVALADEKGASFWKAQGTLLQGCYFALTGKASNAIQMITSGITALRSTGATMWMPMCTYHIWRGPMRNSANSMMLGAALAKR